MHTLPCSLQDILVMEILDDTFPLHFQRTMFRKDRLQFLSAVRLPQCTVVHGGGCLSAQ